MLNKELLIKEARKLNDSTYEEFVGFPNSCSLATLKWSNCFSLHHKEIFPICATLPLAKTTCRSILTGICSSVSMQQSVAIFTSAIVQSAIIIAQGITLANPGIIASPPPPYFGSDDPLIGVPPASALILMPIFLKAMNGGSAKEFAVELSEEVDRYYKTGTAINVNTGLIINWQ